MNSPHLIGERLNVTGSAAFADAFRSRDWPAIRRMAVEQSRAGVLAMDVCLSGGGEDEIRATREFYRECRLDVPVLVDTMSPDVMRTALQVYPKVMALNSANLSRGTVVFEDICELAGTSGVALICGCIDEEGIAVTAERKMLIAARLFRIASKHLPASAIILDLLSLPVKTMPESQAESVQAVRLAKQNFPQCGTLLAVSNISFGQPNTKRSEMEVAFLQQARAAGLDYAIVNAGRVRKQELVRSY